jgi:hypothetical protein
VTGEVMAAAVTGSEPLETAPPVRLFHGCGGAPAVAQASVGQTWFEVAADGNRFLLACAAGVDVPDRGLGGLDRVTQVIMQTG